MINAVRSFVCAGTFLSLVASAATLPEGWQRLDFIERPAAGGARFETDVYLNPQTDEIQVTFLSVDNTSPTASRKDTPLWSIAGSTKSRRWGLFLRPQYNNLLTCWNGDNCGWISDINPGNKYRTTSLRAVFQTEPLDGNSNPTFGYMYSPYAYTNATDYTSFDRPMLIMGDYLAGEGYDEYYTGRARFYGLRVWQRHVLTHDFVPCKDADGNATLYDLVDAPATVTRRGTFVAGPVAPLVRLGDDIIVNGGFERSWVATKKFGSNNQTAASTVGWIGGGINQDGTYGTPSGFKAGTYDLYLQMNSSCSQTVTVHRAGYYDLSYRYAHRKGWKDDTKIWYTLTLDGKPLQSPAEELVNDLTVHTKSITRIPLSRGQHVLKFQTRVENEDATMNLDEVKLVLSAFAEKTQVGENILNNCDFEYQSAFGTSSANYGNLNGTTATTCGWRGGSLNRNRSTSGGHYEFPWDFYNGAFSLILQNGSLSSNIVEVTQSGKYRLTYRYAHRYDYNYNEKIEYRVLVDDDPLTEWTLVEGNSDKSKLTYHDGCVEQVRLSKGRHVLMFQSRKGSGATDVSMAVDDVALTLVRPYKAFAVIVK